jgi:adenylate cyclase
MNKKTAISLIIAAVVFAVTFSFYSLGVFERPELLIYDAKAKLFRSDKVPPKTIKTILVDDASLKALESVAGRWPWPRAIWADLLEFLSLGGAKAVLFDILFTERSDKKNDRALAKATGTSQNVYHSMMLKHEQPDDERNLHSGIDRPLPVGFAGTFALKNISGVLAVKPGSENNYYEIPVEPLRAAAKGVAVVEFAPDSDGVLRRTKPLREYQGKCFPVLGLAPFIDSGSAVVIREGSLSINDRTIAVDRDGNYFINLYDIKNVSPFSIGGIFASLQKIKKGEVEDLVVNPEEFKDAFVFVGASAAATHDEKLTPLGQRSPGVIFHVSLASNYLQHDFLTPPSRRLTVLSALIGAFFTVWAVFFSRKFFLRVVFPIGMLALYVGYVLFAFRANSLVEVVPLVFSTISSSFLSFGYLTFTEGAEKRRVSRLFTQYVSKDVLHEVLHNYKDYLKASAGSKVEITVLFADIRGFTTFSESTPPERIVEMLNIHFSRMAEIILRHGGTLDKYIGDAIMAFWGAPVPTDDHPERAVLAAKEMLDALEDVNKTLRDRGFDLNLKIGIGLSTGVATIGNIGSEQKLNYTVVGDTVNLASRLEGLTKEYDSALILSEHTYERVKDKIACAPLGSVRVKGREKPVDIYTPDGVR